MNASREITVVTYVRIELPLFSKADCCFEDCTGISPEDLGLEEGQALARPATLEDVFLRLAGRELKEE